MKVSYRWSLRSLFVAVTAFALLFMALRVYRNLAISEPMFDGLRSTEVDMRFLEQEAASILAPQGAAPADARALLGFLEGGHFRLHGRFCASSNAFHDVSAKDRFAHDSALRRAFFGPSWLEARSLNACNGQCVEVHRYPQLTSLFCEAADLDDIETLAQGERLQLRFVKINAREHPTRAIRALSRIDSLLVLSIDVNAVPLRDEDLAPIADSKALEFLDLIGGFHGEPHYRQMVSTSGVSHIARCATLRFLVLTGPRLTDSIVQSLATAPALEELLLINTEVTAAGARELAHRMPRLRCIHLVTSKEDGTFHYETVGASHSL